MGLFGAFKNSTADMPPLQFVTGAPQLGQAAATPFGLPGGSKRPALPMSPAVDPNKGPSFWRALDGVLGGQTITEVKDAYRAKQQAQAQQQRYLQMVGSMNLSPEEQLLALNDPEGFMKAVGTRQSFHDVEGGHTILNGPGGGQSVAPKLVEDGGVYGTQTEGGYTQTGQRSMSYADQANQAKVAAEIKNMADRLGIDQATLIETIRNHKAENAIGQGNLGVAQGRLKFDMNKPGESGLPPGYKVRQ